MARQPLSQSWRPAGNVRKLDEAVDPYQKTIEILQKLAAENPIVVEYQTRLALSYHDLGNVLKAQGKLDEAIAQYREPIRIDPENASLRNHLAWVLIAAGPKCINPKQALEHATKAVALSPERADYRTTLGVARYHNGEWNEAISELHKAVELDSDGSATHWLFLAMATGSLVTRTKLDSGTTRPSSG